MAKLGQIKILAERNVKMVELDIDVDDKTVDKIAKIGASDDQEGQTGALQLRLR